MYKILHSIKWWFVIHTTVNRITEYNDDHVYKLTTGCHMWSRDSLPFIPDFLWCSCYLIFSFMCVFCRSLFVLLYLLFWPLCYLSFFDLLLPIYDFWFTASDLRLLIYCFRCPLWHLQTFLSTNWFTVEC